MILPFDVVLCSDGGLGDIPARRIGREAGQDDPIETGPIAGPHDGTHILAGADGVEEDVLLLFLHLSISKIWQCFVTYPILPDFQSERKKVRT